MFKKTLTLLLAVINSALFSQEITSSIPIELKKDRDIFQIVDKENKTVTLFLSDKKRVNTIKLDESLKITDSISATRPDNDYSKMIGYIKNDNQYKLFWSSDNLKEVLVQTFDFDGRKTATKGFKFELKNEKVIQAFSENNRFYIATVLKNSNFLKLYSFDESENLTVTKIDLEGFKFYLSGFQKSNLYGVLAENLLPFESAFSLQKITPESPTSLTYSSKKRKCYVQDGAFIISFDTNPNYTQLISITLSDFSAKEKIYKNPFLKATEFGNLDGNSFLLGNRLFQIKVTEEKMFFTIKDLEDNLLKEFSVLADQEMAFKNSDIIQENGSSSNQRKLGKTKQFLRKASAAYPGISCYKSNDNYIIKIGSVSEEQDNFAVYGALVGGFGGSIAGSIISYYTVNSTLDNFNSYANRKIVYVDCLFDMSNNHSEGTIAPLAFDKIQTYVNENSSLVSPTIFKLNDFYYFGNYNKSSKLYEFRKFID